MTEKARRTSRCERFRFDGERCQNMTYNADQWCREPECGGYLRPTAAWAPEASGPFRGSRGQIEKAASPRPDVDIDAADELRVSQRAVDSFRFHHGGDRETAETEIRIMVEDFSLNGLGMATRGGYYRLAREGFEVLLSPDLAVVTGYTTTHRERTWSQVKAKVKSRFRGASDTRPSPADEAPVLLEPPSAILDVVDVSTLHFTGSVLSRGVALMRRHGEEGEAEAYMRRKLKNDFAGKLDVERSSNGAHLVHCAGGTWILRPDLLSAIGFRPTG